MISFECAKYSPFDKVGTRVLSLAPHLSYLKHRETQVTPQWKNFVKAIFGGAAISGGGTIYLSQESHLAGAFLFSLGLFTIYTFGLSLYTGKVCYIPNKKPKYLLEVLVVYLGNVVGTVGFGYMLRGTKLVKLVAPVQTIVAAKLSDTLYSTFVMAVLCGVMMCIAVLGYQMVSDGAGKLFVLVLPIMVFILAGFEHSIADLFYFSLADSWGAQAVLYSVVIALGNLVGGGLLPLLVRVTDGKKLGC